MRAEDEQELIRALEEVQRLYKKLGFPYIYLPVWNLELIETLVTRSAVRHIRAIMAAKVPQETLPANFDVDLFYLRVEQKATQFVMDEMSSGERLSIRHRIENAAYMELLEYLVSGAVRFALPSQLYGRDVRSWLQKTSRSMPDAVAALRRPDARGGANPPVRDQSVEQRFRDEATALLVLWKSLVKLYSTDVSAWTEMADDHRVKSLSESSRANAKKLLQDLDIGKLRGADAQPRFLSLRHAALNVGDERMIHMDTKSLEKLFYATPSRAKTS